MGAGSRLVGFEEAEAARRCPSSATSPTTTSRELEPTVPLPADGHGIPESRTRRRRDARPLRPRRRRRPRSSPATRRRSQAGSTRASRGTASPRGDARRRCAASRPRALRGDGADGQGAHPRRRRLPVRSLAARRATDVGVAARRLPRAAPRQSVAVPVPARPRRDRPRRLVARAARRLRRRPGQPLPDRRNDGAHRGRRRAPPVVGEGPGRARDARRPRPERSVARLPCRHRARGAEHGGRALLARRRTSSPRSSASFATASRRSTSSVRASRPGTVSGAPKIRAMQLISELEGFRRGPYGGAVLYSLPGGTMDACIALRTMVDAGRAWPTSRRAPGSSRTPTPPRSTRSACASSRRSRPRSTSPSRRLRDDRGRGTEA